MALIDPAQPDVHHRVVLEINVTADITESVNAGVTPNLDMRVTGAGLDGMAALTLIQAVGANLQTELPAAALFTAGEDLATSEPVTWNMPPEVLTD